MVKGLRSWLRSLKKSMCDLYRSRESHADLLSIQIFSLQNNSQNKIWLNQHNCLDASHTHVPVHVYLNAYIYLAEF